MPKVLLYIGVMSGSSLDGIDVALIDFSNTQCKVVATHFQPYTNEIKSALLALHFPSDNELEKSALIANQLAYLYAEAVNALLAKNRLNSNQVMAIGCHGQTIRHQPHVYDGIGYTIQLGNNSLLAELTKMTVVGDFRSRDIAAGGQGAPLVPAFHQAVFASNSKNRAIVNIGGIANITFLATNGDVLGFDSGPGNILLDHWIQLQLGQAYDNDGAWASTGTVHLGLLESMLADAYFAFLPPKSTGRDLFNETWLKQHLQYIDCSPKDIARTLVELTSDTIFQAMTQYCPNVDEVYLCGGGAHNKLLKDTLQSKLNKNIMLSTTDELGVDVDWVEATAFAWLAQQTLRNEPSNLPSATGANGLRILGAIYPA
jgi:anhydro-N-acetylmuramic acid kinase